MKEIYAKLGGVLGSEFNAQRLGGEVLSPEILFAFGSSNLWITFPQCPSGRIVDVAHLTEHSTRRMLPGLASSFPVLGFSPDCTRAPCVCVVSELFHRKSYPSYRRSACDLLNRFVATIRRRKSRI